MTARPNALFCVVALMALARVSPAGDPPVRALVFGMTPIVGVEPTRARFTPLAEHMAGKLGLPVELLVTGSYGELASLVASGEVDLAKFSPLAYVHANKRIPGLRLIATQVANGSVDYSSYLVARQGNPHDSVKNLEGARICFADENSTSGYLFPMAYLKQLGFSPGRSFVGPPPFGGSHRACLEGLFKDRWDLAATWTGAIRDARSAGLGVGELVIVVKTGRIPNDAYCLRPGLDPDLAQRIRQTLLNTNTLNREGRKVLSMTLGINGWVPVEDGVYDGIRKVEAEVR